MFVYLHATTAIFLFFFSLLFPTFPDNIIYFWVGRRCESFILGILQIERSLLHWQCISKANNVTWLASNICLFVPFCFRFETAPKKKSRTFLRRSNILRRILFQFGWFPLSSFFSSQQFVRDSQMQWFIMRPERSFKCICSTTWTLTGASYVALATVRHLNYQFLLVLFCLFGCDII